MLTVTPQMRVLVALQPVDFRCGIDGLAQVCRERLKADPFTGAVFVFRNRARTAIKLICFDGSGMWLCHRRLSEGRFRWWPPAESQDSNAVRLLAHELQVLINGGDPTGARVPPAWKPIPTNA